MKLKLKKWQIVLIIVLGILVISNPSLTRFKEFAGNNKSHQYMKKYNFYVCSTYVNFWDLNNDGNGYDDNGNGYVEYIGFLNNFINIYSFYSH